MKELFDVHCHIIPGVDDGARNLEEAVNMLLMEKKQGVKNIIATPHFRFKMFETDLQTVKKQFALLKREADKLELNLYLGCEFHSTMEMVSMLKKEQVSTMAGSRYVLVEFSGGDSASHIKERVYSLISAGYKPVIAHIERYEALYKQYDFIEELAEMGARMQVNADSIIGKEGFSVKRFCKKLMQYDLLSFVGSDCHDCRERVSRIGEAYAYAAKKLGEDYADRIFITNPYKIINL
ncbi:MAG: capsular biosynthesis protein [Clostridiales bacterium]|nr:capsular biosynthesis protein [Candidatus Blautia equi]